MTLSQMALGQVTIYLLKIGFFIHHVPPARATDTKNPTNRKQRIEKRDHAT